MTIDGEPMAGMTRRQIAHRLSFLPQQPTAPDEMTVEQLVRQGRFAHVGLFRRYQQRDEEAIAWALESTGLAPLAQRSLSALSGGERQRAWISAALAQEARILLLDEPTSFLDIGYQIEVLDLVHRLSRERGVTVVMAIHDLNQPCPSPTASLFWKKAVWSSTARRTDLAESGLIERVFRVDGTFVQLSADGPPHFDVHLQRWAGSTTRPTPSAPSA